MNRKVNHVVMEAKTLRDLLTLGTNKMSIQANGMEYRNNIKDA